MFATNAFKSSGDERLRLVSAKAMIQWSDRLNNNSDANLFVRAELIHRATQCATDSPQVIQALLDFLIEIGAKPDIATTLKHGLAIGKDAESIHFVIGIISLMRMDWKTADLHLSIAETFGSIVPEIAANLLVAYARMGESQSKRSMKVLTTLVERYSADKSLVEAYKSIRESTLPAGTEGT